MIRVYWKGKFGHTRCAKAKGFSTQIPLWAFNLAWWRESICRECVPEPILSEAHAKKVGWPW